MVVVHGEPERFVLNVVPGATEASRRCTFAIPAGNWFSGQWEVVGRVPSGTPFLCKTVGADTLCQTGGESSGERYTVSGQAGAGALAQINAAVGGAVTVETTDLFAEKQRDGAVDAVVSFTLTLTGIQIVGTLDVAGALVTCIYDPEVLPSRTRRVQGTGAADLLPVGTVVTSTYDADGGIRE